jgi:hypothetical protein
MPKKKRKERLGNATLASVKKEMAEPRMAKSTQKEGMKHDDARIARKPAEIGLVRP